MSLIAIHNLNWIVSLNVFCTFVMHISSVNLATPLTEWFSPGVCPLGKCDSFIAFCL